MCNYEMLVRLPAACSQTRIDQLEATIRSIVSSLSTVCSTNKAIVDAGAKDGGSYADVRASHLHCSLPVSRHAHAQLQRTNLRVFLQKICTQIVQLLEIGLRRRIQLPHRHESHQMELRAVAQNELCQRKALFRETTTLPIYNTTLLSSTSLRHSYALQQRRLEGRHVQQEDKRN